jgi:hypothetical protein
LKRDPVLRMMLRSPGFHAVAAAVRSSTLSAQAARHHGKFARRAIRYGLLSDIRQAGFVGKRELLSLISSFISSFNQEGRRLRAARLRAAHIEGHELSQFAGMLEELDSASTAGALLCGLASCLGDRAAAIEIEPELAQAIPA